MSPARKTGLLLITLGLLLQTSCLGRKAIIPDPSVPYRFAEEVEAVVWLRTADGTYAKTKVRILPGWWGASPQIVEPVRK